MDKATRFRLAGDPSIAEEVASCLAETDGERSDKDGAVDMVLFGLTTDTEADLQALITQPPSNEALMVVLPGDPVAGLWALTESESIDGAVSASATAGEVGSRARRALSHAQMRIRANRGDEQLRLTRTQIESIAMVDMDTGLFNRRYLLARLREALATARRYGRDLSLVVFRVTNHEDLIEDLGEDAMAEVYEAVADVLAVALRNADLEARVATDTFALMLPETDVNGAAVVADRIVDDLHDTAIVGDVKLSVASAVASSTDHTDSAHEMLRQAESRTGIEADETVP